MPESRYLGSLTSTDPYESLWNAAPIGLPLFDGAQVPVEVEHQILEGDTRFIDEMDQALAKFLPLAEADRLALSELVYDNCRDFLEDIGFEEEHRALWELEDAAGIWAHVRPLRLDISCRPRRDEDVYITVICACDWEVEHGLQLVFRQGKQITRVSQIDGHLTEADADDKPDVEDALLSAFVQDERPTPRWMFWRV